ncbi:DUF1266 domain-containing protein [Nocardiopsis coralliicola]
MPNQIERLESAVAGTLARNDFFFDEDKGTVKVPVLLSAWSASSMLALLAGLALLITAGCLAVFAGALPALLCAAAAVASLTLFGWAQSRSGFEVRILEQAVVYKRHRIPFSEVRPEFLVLEPGAELRLMFRAPGMAVRLAEFRPREEAQAHEFRNRLWEVFSRPDLRAAGTYGSSGITPVQRWLLGVSAMFMETQGFPVDRVGASSSSLVSSHQRKQLAAMLEQSWGVRDRDGLLRAAQNLLLAGHREDFALSAAVAGRHPQEVAEYLHLLSEADREIAAGGGGLASPRVGAAVQRLLALRAVQGADPDAGFTGSLLSDRDFAAEEDYRVRTLQGIPPAQALEMFSGWDYVRAGALYRWGFMLGMLSEDECWTATLPVAQELQKRYRSWPEMGRRYLEGRMLWSVVTASESQDAFEKTFNHLTTDQRSPWLLADWHLPLRRDWH